jgi:nitric oxide dioxygenase
MVENETIRIVKSTVPSLELHAEAITRRFYQLMFAGNPEVEAYFNQAHQHSGGQQRALAAAICAYAANIDNLAALGPAVDLIAHKHCSLAIQPEHYPIVGKYLLMAIKDVLQDAATDEVIAAWAKAYDALAKVCIERESVIYKEQAAVVGGWNGYRRVVVDAKIPESEIITSFYLRSSDSQPLPRFLPGQYITVKIDDTNVPTAPRNYSLSDRPGLPYYRISVKRESAADPDAPEGVVSNHLHDRVVQGDTLLIGPPCGNFTLDVVHATARPIVLLSGGIGLTPVLSMLKELAHVQVSTPVYFIHAARNSRVHALADEVRRVASISPNIRTHFRYDAPLTDDLRKGRCDSVGILDLTLLRELLPSPDGEFYFCGPKPFMSGIYHALRAWGVSESRLHFEFFGPRQDLVSHDSTAIGANPKQKSPRGRRTRRGRGEEMSGAVRHGAHGSMYPL